jgi:hypothetical protein
MGDLPSLPNAYLYLDSAGVESLFAQTVDRVEIELVESTKKTTEEKSSAKLGLGNALAALIGIKADASLEAAKAKTQLEQAKLGLTVEHKIARLQNYILATGYLTDDLASAVKRSKETNAKVYINVLHAFDMPQFAHRGGGVEQANDDGALEFEIPSLSSAKVVMAASLAKFPSLASGRLGRLSHVVLHFGGFQGKNVPLHVFGYIISLSAVVCQIKPYAIWL